MFTCSLTISITTREGIVDFQRYTELPFAPFAGLIIVFKESNNETDDDDFTVEVIRWSVERQQFDLMEYWGWGRDFGDEVIDESRYNDWTRSFTPGTSAPQPSVPSPCRTSVRNKLPIDAAERAALIQRESSRLGVRARKVLSSVTDERVAMINLHPSYLLKYNGCGETTFNEILNWLTTLDPIPQPLPELHDVNCTIQPDGSFMAVEDSVPVTPRPPAQ